MQNTHDYAFNRRNWILSHLDQLKLSSSETIVLLVIDLLSEFNEKISKELLSRKCSLSEEETEKCLMELNAKGILKMIPKGYEMTFDIDNVFNYTTEKLECSDIYELFETEFGRVLSRKECETISEWLRLYDRNTIINALREASIAKKKSIGYVDKVLANGTEQI